MVGAHVGTVTDDPGAFMNPDPAVFRDGLVLTALCLRSGPIGDLGEIHDTRVSERGPDREVGVGVDLREADGAKLGQREQGAPRDREQDRVGARVRGGAHAATPVGVDVVRRQGDLRFGIDPALGKYPPNRGVCLTVVAEEVRLLRTHAQEEGRHRGPDRIHRGGDVGQRPGLKIEDAAGGRGGIPDVERPLGHLGGTQDEIREQEGLLGIASVRPDRCIEAPTERVGPVSGGDFRPAKFWVAVLRAERHLSVLGVDVPSPIYARMRILDQPRRDAVVRQPRAETDVSFPLFAVLDDVVPVAVIVAVVGPARRQGLEIEEQGFVDEVLSLGGHGSFRHVFVHRPGCRVISRVRGAGGAEPTPSRTQGLPIDTAIVEQVEIPVLVTADRGRPVADPRKDITRSTRNALFADDAVVIVQPAGVACPEG